ncbi:MAG TPA: tRNA (adenosine(37)-N6)-dimethylallyltransferase MiaA [Bryobacteraceae bacterium]|nr:tRNA (adenosine(37)-N6)-dimethylallyltransferase MiaA [Bryobacteraceae bacterium]
MSVHANPPLLVIVGPTGSGKSTLALQVCEQHSGEIVNCDSLQLYRGFHVGTAKTPESERRGVPHHLLDVLDPPDGYSAGEYARIARGILGEISTRGRLPVVVGGTGFYLRALLNGLPRLPESDEAVRARLMDREQRHPGSMSRLLRRLDPTAAARLHPNDTQRVMRAVEIRLVSGKSSPPAVETEPLAGYRLLKLGLDPDRALLYQALNVRTRTMFESGLVEEVRALLAGGCTGEEKPFESLGYRQALAYLRGEYDLERAIYLTQLETRHYAKRQWTWFRRDPDIQWLRGFGDSPVVWEKCSQILRRFL